MSDLMLLAEGQYGGWGKFDDNVSAGAVITALFAEATESVAQARTFGLEPSAVEWEFVAVETATIEDPLGTFGAVGYRFTVTKPRMEEPHEEGQSHPPQGLQLQSL